MGELLERVEMNGQVNLYSKEGKRVPLSFAFSVSNFTQELEGDTWRKTIVEVLRLDMWVRAVGRRPW